MAINIQSGQTWAEIRAHLNEESSNMESNANKYAEEYADSLFVFSPGETNMINLGNATINNKGTTIAGESAKGLYIDANSAESGKSGVLNSVFAYRPLSDGKIKPKIVISKIHPVAYYQNNGGQMVGGNIGMSYGSWDANAVVSIKISINMDDGTNSKNVIVWEENEVGLYESQSNPDSVFNSDKIITLDEELNICQGKYISLIVEITYHSGFYSGRNYWTIYSGDIVVNMYGGISNPVLGTSANTVEVWQDE